MNNEELILQKLEELSKDIKELRKDFDIYKENVAKTNQEVVRLSVALEHLEKSFEEQKKILHEEIDKAWNEERHNKKELYEYIDGGFKTGILELAQKNAKILGLTAIGAAIVIPVITAIIQGVLK